MKKPRPKFFIIGLTLFVFSFSTSGRSDTFYRCVNSKGSVMITNTGPTDPDFKCTLAASYRNQTPQERGNEQKREGDLRQRQQINRAHEETQKQKDRLQAQPNAKTSKQACYKSSILSPTPFMGNNGEIFKLADGSLWKIMYEYQYLYEYYPNVTICPSQGKLVIKGKTLNVTQM